MVIVKIFSYLLSILTGLESVAVATAFSYVFVMISEKNTSFIYSYILIVITGIILINLIKLLRITSINRYVYNTNFYNKQNILLKEYEKEDHDGIISFIQNDYKKYEENFLVKQFDLVEKWSTAIFSIIFALSNNVILTIWFIGFSVLPIVIQKLAKKKITYAVEDWRSVSDGFLRFLNDYIRGLPLFFQYNLISTNKKKIDENINNIESSNKKMNNTISYVTIFIECAGYIAFFIPIAIGVYFVLNQKIKLAAFMAILNVNNGIINSIIGIANTKNLMNSVDNIHTEILSINNNMTLNISKDKTPLIEFDNLTALNVKMESDKKILFEDINFKVFKYNKVLIQGGSGTGKSTLLNILRGTVQPTGGEILINNQKVNCNILKNFFSYVEQTPIIFKDTLLYNLTLGKYFLKEDIIEVCEIVELNELLERIGLEGYINDDISGGEMKRLSLARALLFDREILLIDEGTASIDEETSIAIHKNILNLKKTIIEVDHHIPDDIKNLYTNQFVLKNKKLLSSD